MKTLRVCLSSELPLIEDRDSNIIYFLYDKLMVFLGKSIYTDPYAIVETMPINPAYNVLYFTLDDGKIKSYIDDIVREIGEIESQEQLEILKQAGTSFFVNSETRYLDLRRRIITLPFNNGTYELTVSLAHDLKIDKDTVIGFNPETNTFEIIGKSQDFDLVFSRKYRGIDSASARTIVGNNSIKTEVKISEDPDNILELDTNGLIVNPGKKVSVKEFEKWVSDFEKYKSDMEVYLGDLVDKVGDAQDVVSVESVNARILESLQAVYPEIEAALEVYKNASQQITDMEKRVKDYSDQKYQEAYEDLHAQIVEATSNPWEDFNYVLSEDEDDSEGTESGDSTETT